VETRKILQELEHAATRAAVTAERALLEHLRGGCMAPIGAIGRVEGTTVHLSAVVLSADGKQRLAAEDSAPSAEAELLGQRVAKTLLAKGAGGLIAGSRAL